MVGMVRSVSKPDNTKVKCFTQFLYMSALIKYSMLIVYGSLVSC
jgi:hypothetical protein